MRTHIASRLREEDGHTLVELLVVCAILGLVTAAVAGVYEVSQRVYTTASGREEAQLRARAGLDRLVNELRLIGSYYTGATGAGAAITAATPTSVSFLGDVDADSVTNGTETTTSATVAAGSTTVTVNGGATGAFGVYANAAGNDRLYIADGSRREVLAVTAAAGASLSLQSALGNDYPAGSLVRSVETVTYAYDAANQTLTRTLGGGAPEPIIDNVANLTLTYYDGANPPVVTAVLADIREVEISLTTMGGGGARRTMTARVRPRSLP